jgi:hypothetical protein
VPLSRYLTIRGKVWKVSSFSVGWPINSSGHAAKSNGMLNTNFLFASLIWGSVGVGYFIYGKKQSSWPAMAAGVLMVAISYFAGSALVMSLVCLGLIAAVYFLLKQGY